MSCKISKLIATTSDDGTVVCVWQGGKDGLKSSIVVFELGCPATSVAWSVDGLNLYIGALDNKIYVYDLCKGKQVYALTGHTDVCVITQWCLPPLVKLML